MSMPRFGWVVSLAVFLSTVSVAVSKADEEKVPLDKVPKPVLNAFMKKFPGASITAAIKEGEGSETIYEIESKVKGMSVDAELKPDGTFVAIEKEIKTADLPAAVSSAVKTKYPNGKFEKAEEVTQGEKVTYEVLVGQGDGTRKEVSVDPSGKILD